PVQRPRGSLAWLVLGLALLVPFTALTVNVAKSLVVGSILVPPLLLLCVWPLLGSAHRLPGKALVALAAVAIVAGTFAQVSKSRHRGAWGRASPESTALLAIHDELIERCEALGLHQPVVAVDTVNEYLQGRTFSVVAFERHGARLDFQQALGSSIHAPDE